MPLLREDEAIIHASVTGVNFPSVYSWSALEGGDVESNDTKVWPGGMQPQVSLGGPRTRTDVTVKRPYSSALHPYIVQLENVAGSASMRVSYTPLDATGTPNGGPVTMHGILKSVSRPNYEASASAPAYLTLVMSANVEGSIGS